MFDLKNADFIVYISFHLLKAGRNCKKLEMVIPKTFENGEFWEYNMGDGGLFC